MIFEKFNDFSLSQKKGFMNKVKVIENTMGFYYLLIF